MGAPVSRLKTHVRIKGRAMSGDADLFAGRVSVMSVLGGQNMHDGLCPAPSCIPAAGARYILPTFSQ